MVALTRRGRLNPVVTPRLAMNLTLDQIATDLRGFITPSYPDIDIRVAPWDRDPTQLAVYFRDPKFALIYPYQR